MFDQISSKNKLKKTGLAFTSAALVSVFLGSPVAAAPKTVQAEFDAAVTITSAITAKQCDNSGTELTFESGSIASGGISPQLILKQRRTAGGRTYEDIVGSGTFDLTIKPGQENIVKQGASANGVGGNPYIYFDFGNPTQSELMDSENYVGRCVQGTTFNLGSRSIPGVRGSASAGVGAKACGSSKTSFTISGTASIPGVAGKLFLTNNPNNSQHDSTRDASFSSSFTTTIPQGIERNFAREFNVGGNPLVYMKFSPSGSEIYLGRCKDLM